MTSLTLSFPHGASVKNCEDIVRFAENIVSAGVSEGGMQVTSKYGLNTDDVTFSENSMHYVFGHARKKPIETCERCGSSNFAIARDMKATRRCSCGHSWLPNPTKQTGE